MRINFFLNVLSIHQAPLIRRLSEIYEIHVFYDEPLSKVRKELGWHTPDFGSAKICPIEYIDDKDLLTKMSIDTVNIFSGLYAYPKVQKWLDKSIKTSASNYIQMESLKFHGVKGALRKIKYRLLAVKYNKKIKGIFSQGGKEQLEEIGFRNIYSFAYFLDKSETIYKKENNITRFVYFGSLSVNKRILELTNSFAKSLNSNSSLDIYGSSLDVSIDQLNKIILYKKNIKYNGVIPNSQVMTTLKEYDYLILPSKAEGWGAVVGEALLCGVGVIVTDTAGINNYLKENFSYGVYITDFSKMEVVIGFLENLLPLSIDEREKIQDEAYCLSSEYGANLIIRYLS